MLPWSIALPTTETSTICAADDEPFAGPPQKKLLPRSGGPGLVAFGKSPGAPAPYLTTLKFDARVQPGTGSCSLRVADPARTSASPLIRKLSVTRSVPTSVVPPETTGVTADIPNCRTLPAPKVSTLHFTVPCTVGTPEIEKVPSPPLVPE